MIFSNPVDQDYIRPPDSPPKAGNFRVVQDFGPTSLKVERPLGKFAHFHRGLDLGDLRCGAAVLAAGDGKVAYSANSSEFGQRIVIDHGGGWFSSYAHLNARLVVKGRAVTAGAKVGTVGSTGHAIGCHLHFGVKSDLKPGQDYYSDRLGEWRDPWPLLRQNVTVHPDLDNTVNIRSLPDHVTGDKYAKSEAGRIVRADGVDLGSSATWRPWGGTVTGTDYGPSDKWERMELDGHDLYVASAFAVLSAK